jgi:formiminotetrahydrofolate cyclodeaminase
MSKKHANTEALERYAASYTAIKAHEAILADCKAGAIEELNLAGGTAVVDGVEFCIKQISDKKYGPDVQAILDDLQEAIDEQKKRAEEAGKVKVLFKETLQAKIPKSNVATVLGRVREYAKYFG